MIYIRRGQLVARGLHVARHSIFSGPRKHSEEILKLKISSSLVLRLTCQRLASLSIRRYGPPLKAAFQKWPLSQTNYPPLINIILTSNN